jgi:broad specificity phosphatase PhoE
MRRGVRLYFVRHGETDWNFEQRIQGQLDIPLNGTGRRQAARNGAKLKELISDVGAVDFVSSPLVRTIETMEIVRTVLGLERSGYGTDARLKEVHFGDWQGRRWSEVQAFDPEGYAARLADTFRWRPRGGESYAELMTRSVAWLESLSRDCIVVSHGGVSRVLRGYLLGLHPDEVPHLSVPQDRVLVLEAGRFEWV